MLRQQIIPQSNWGNKCPYEMNPMGICVHNTANDAPAQNEVNYMSRNTNEVSFHIAVDDKEAIQAIPFNRNAWASGDGNGIGNRGHIHIEVCYSQSGGERFVNAEKRAVKVIAYLLNKYGWGISHVKKHQDFSGKYCPHRTLDMGWERFLNMIKQEMSSSNSEGKVIIGLDDPNNITIENSDVLNVRGWVLGEWNTVEIWIDGNNFGGVELNKSRPDVFDAYPQYGNKNAGFVKTIKFNGIDNGKHECRLKVCDKNGQFHEIAKSFTIKKELRIALDLPNEKQGNKFKGWALSGKGIKSIECFVDDGFIGNFKINKQRSDVAEVYNYYYNGVNCGFEYDFDNLRYPAGKHVFKLKVTSNDGEVREIGNTFLGGNTSSEQHNCEEIIKENRELKEKLKKINEISEV